MGTLVLTQIPDPHIPTTITRNKLALIGMNDDIINGGDMGDNIPNGSPMGVVALNASSPCVPDLDSAILGAGDHPLALAMEGYARDVSRMAIKREHRAWVCRANVIKLDIVVSSCCKITFVGRDT